MVSATVPQQHYQGSGPSSADRLQDLLGRPRRNRKSETVRRAFSETILRPENFILPVFVHDGEKVGPV